MFALITLQLSMYHALSLITLQLSMYHALSLITLQLSMYHALSGKLFILHKSIIDIFPYFISHNFNEGS